MSMTTSTTTTTCNHHDSDRTKTDSDNNVTNTAVTALQGTTSGMTRTGGCSAIRGTAGTRGATRINSPRDVYASLGLSHFAIIFFSLLPTSSSKDTKKKKVDTANLTVANIMPGPGSDLNRTLWPRSTEVQAQSKSVMR
jgi:hypothetical protein